MSIENLLKIYGNLWGINWKFGRPLAEGVLDPVKSCFDISFKDNGRPRGGSPPTEVPWPLLAPYSHPTRTLLAPCGRVPDLLFESQIWVFSAFRPTRPLQDPLQASLFSFFFHLVFFFDFWCHVFRFGTQLGFQNWPKINKKWFQWPPERHFDPQMSPGGYIGAKILLKRCFVIRHIRKKSSSWHADSLENLSQRFWLFLTTCLST